MKLMTKEIAKKLPALGSTERIPAGEKAVAVKFFTPDSNWTWYVVEGEEQPDGDWFFFGLVIGMEKEWGMFALSDLERARGPFGLPIERDLYFGNPKISEII